MNRKRFNLVGIALVLAAALILALPIWSLAQDKASKPMDAKDLADQLRELQEKIGKLETALKQSHKGMPSGKPDAGGMGGMPMGMMGDKKMGQGMMGMGGMEGMKPDDMMGQMMQKMGEMMQMMAQMQSNGVSSMGGMADKQMGMGMMGGPGMGGPQGEGMGGVQINVQENETIGMMGMMGMGSMGQSGAKGMKGMGKMQMTSALPGFPGASHIYHIGATGFFLDHPEHVTLTTKQQTTLSKIKEKALLAKATSQRKIDAAEQELWELTGLDEPDAAKIEAKIKEVEKLKGEQRLAFIRSVGEAAKVLTEEQRAVLLGMAVPPADKADPHAAHKPDPTKTEKPKP